ncbi:MAG: insulinase family protein, partial [Chloroflexota bacterium]|nr:insulinase family protein [Chloroflexota bacterium]
MAFNGTKSFAKHELVDYLESIGMRFGADANAYTGFDETVYMLTVPTDSADVLDKGIQILEEWAHEVSFDSTEIEKERGVVIEEWRLGQGAAARMRDKQFPILFKHSRYAERLPIGQKKVLESFTHDQLKRFYRDWYRPDLMAVVAVGDFDKARVERLIRERFSDIPAAKNARPRPQFPVPDHDETLVAIATDREATGTSIGVLYKQTPRTHRTVGAYRQAIVEQLYNGMLNARLSELMQKPDAPFLDASSSQGQFIRSKEAYALGAAVKEGGVERGLEALLTEAERVARHGFTQSELDRQKRDAVRAMERAYAEREKTNSSQYASEYVSHYLESEPIPGVAYEYELYKRFVPGISLAEVNRLPRQWITDRNRVLLLNAPQKDSVHVPEPRELLAVFDAVDRKDIAAYTDSLSDTPLVERPPKPAPVVAERKIDTMGVVEWTLANGVRIILKPTDFKQDQILFRGYSVGGTSLVPDEDYVSASTAAAVVQAGGIGKFNWIDLQKVLAGKAVAVQPSITELEEGISGSASPQDVETLFQLIYLYFTAPRRDSVAFAAFHSRIKGSLENRSASPEAAFQDTLQVTLAQHHTRARPLTSALFDEMDLEKSLRFYRDRFADASDFTFIFVGTFEPEKLKPLVERYLGGLPATRRTERWRDIGMEYPKGVIRKTVKRGVEPKSQTRIVFTGPVKFSRENVYALQSLADVLEIRLRERLREELGGTYGVSVDASAEREPDQEYEITISFGSAPERLQELTEVVFQQIDSLKTVGPAAKDVNKVKETQRRTRETSLRRNDAWAAQLYTYTRNGWDPRGILTYDALVESLTPELVQRTAQQYLNTKNYVQVSLEPERYTK